MAENHEKYDSVAEAYDYINVPFEYWRNPVWKRGSDHGYDELKSIAV